MRGFIALLACGSAAACSLTTSFSDLVGSGENANDASESLDSSFHNDGSANPNDASNTGDSQSFNGGDAASSAYRTLVLSDGPVAYYRLSDTGTTAKDETGGHDGTYVGTSSHGPGAIAGDSDQALVVAGAGWIDIGSAFPFTGNEPYSIEAWVSPSPAKTLTGVVARNLGTATTSPSDGYSLYIQPNFVPSFSRWSSTNEEGAGGSAIASGSFTHVVGTYDGATAKLYLNGVLAGNAAAAEPLIDPSVDLLIAATRNATYGFFIGSIDEVALYNKALGASQIQAHFAAGTGK